MAYVTICSQYMDLWHSTTLLQHSYHPKLRQKVNVPVKHPIHVCSALGRGRGGGKGGRRGEGGRRESVHFSAFLASFMRFPAHIYCTCAQKAKLTIQFKIDNTLL